MQYFWLFISGMLAFNAIPHFVHGISGEPFFLPQRQNRGQRGAPVVNVAWGFVNFLLAVVIWRFVFDWPTEFYTKILVILAGGLLLAIGLSFGFTKRAKLAKSKKD
ncbi:hypothetical protein FWF48_00115 [Candidatus Saccharibacteria bacterium]|nr:hypothetical protein [Candidatus Saccharibacteria bacterium]